MTKERRGRPPSLSDAGAGAAGRPRGGGGGGECLLHPPPGPMQKRALCERSGAAALLSPLFYRGMERGPERGAGRLALAAQVHQQ